MVGIASVLVTRPLCRKMSSGSAVAGLWSDGASHGVDTVGTQERHGQVLDQRMSLVSVSGVLWFKVVGVDFTGQTNINETQRK